MKEVFWTVYFPLILLSIGGVVALILNRKKCLRPHTCWNGKPIISIYSSFNSRNVIYECKCGKRYLVKGVSATYMHSIGINTAGLITTKEIAAILNNEDTEITRYYLAQATRNYQLTN